MGVSQATSGNYHPDNRHSVNPLENGLTWLSHTLRNLFIRPDPVISELKVTQFMLDDEHPFKEFAPDMFSELRQLEGITPQHYLSSLEKTEKEQLSEGASGAFMFFCGDMEFIVKTINHQEALVLHRSLRHYLAYLKQHPSSLLVRFLGSYSLGVYAQTFHFVVMRNIFEPKIDINERYDLKGSWTNRSAAPSPPNKRVLCRHCNDMFIPAEKMKCTKIVGLHEGNVVLKDNDFRIKISLQTNEGEELLKIIKRDSDLLAALGVMDYR
jgi:1-phosphatidylinositol-4-phosphate 5-kinase